MRAMFPPDGADGTFNMIRRVDDLDVLLIDSTVPGASHGELDAPTLAWLDTTLASSPARPALLFLHHPPFDSGITYMDAMKLRNADALEALIKRHPRTLLVAAGHVHRAVQSVYAGVAGTICPAGEQATVLNLDPAARDAIMIEPQAFHLHMWLPGTGLGRLVTYVMPIGEFAGPYLCG
jgi:3',5'-cyclic AMP phosphodiesterase CpdA